MNMYYVFKYQTHLRLRLVEGLQVLTERRDDALVPVGVFAEDILFIRNAARIVRSVATSERRVDKGDGAIEGERGVRTRVVDIRTRAVQTWE